MRFLALDDVNVAAGTSSSPSRATRCVGASDGGASPLLVAGTRAGYKFVALGFDVRDSDLPLRTAWPLFVVNCINWFTDEDAQYLSSFRTGDVWRIPVAGGVGAGDREAPGRPDGQATEQTCPYTTENYYAANPDTCTARARFAPAASR